MVSRKTYRDATFDNLDVLQDSVLPVVVTNPPVGKLPIGSLFLNATNQTLYYKGSATLLSPITTSVGLNYQNTIAGGGNSFYINTSALVLPPTGQNTAVGVGSGNLITTGFDNTFYGFLAGFSTTTGFDNTFIGNNAGFANNTGNGNTAIGSNAGKFLSSSISHNTLVGFNAGFNCVSSDCTAVGASAGINLTIASQGTFFGSSAGFSVTTGNFNVAVGCLSMGLGNCTGASNVCVGGSSGKRITTGNFNTFVGDSTGGTANLSGAFNTALGYQAGSALTTTNNSTFVGGQAGILIAAGSDNNTFIGFLSGGTTTSGTNNTALGANSSINNALSFSTVIGAGTTGSLSNNVQIGRNATDTVNCGSSLFINAIQLTDGNSHISSGSATPAFAAGTGAGTAPTLNINNGTDLSGEMDLTTGAAPVANATIFSITFALPYAGVPQVLILPKNANAAALSGTSNPFVSLTGTTSFTFTSNSTPLAAATAYKWSYMAMH